MPARAAFKRIGAEVAGAASEKLAKDSIEIGAQTAFGRSADDWASRILPQVELDSAANAHFNSRHGAGTTIEQQWNRAISGQYPENPALGNRPVDSSRFFSDSDTLEAYIEAVNMYNPDGRASFHFLMNRPIGEGIEKFGRGYVGSTNAVSVVFREGQPWTIYPKISPLKEMLDF